MTLRNFLAPLLLALGPLPGQEEARPPNIILFMADDLGYGHLGCYGQTKIETPHIDQLAREGMRFTQAYAGCTVCAPSRSVLMTGLHGGHTSIRGNLGSISLLDEDITIAEVLRDAGYANGGYGKWGLGIEGSPGHPSRQGFTDFLGYLHQVHAHFYYPYWLSTNNDERYPLPGNEDGARGQYSHDVLIERAMRFIDEHKGRPFFCYLPITIPHVEVVAPESSVKQYRDRWEEVPGHQEKRRGYIVSPEPKASFAAMISHMDRDVGRILDQLESLEIDDNTVFIFTSDNGAQSRYDVNEEFFDASGPLRGYKGSMYEGGLRVPLIVRWPGKVKAGSVSHHQCYFPDYMPTLAELAGAKPPADTDGISFVAALLGEAAAGHDQKTHRYLYWELLRRDRQFSCALRMGDWKLVRNKHDGPSELFDLRLDPGETANLSEKRPGVMKRLLALLEQARTEPRDYARTEPVSVDDYVR